MPVRACTIKGKPGYKYGSEGKCYPYIPGDAASKNKAFNKAKKQGQAIEKSRGNW